MCPPSFGTSRGSDEQSGENGQTVARAGRRRSVDRRGGDRAARGSKSWSVERERRRGDQRKRRRIGCRERGRRRFVAGDRRAAVAAIGRKRQCVGSGLVAAARHACAKPDDRRRGCQPGQQKQYGERDVSTVHGYGSTAAFQ